MSWSETLKKLRAFFFRNISDQRKYPRVAITVKVTNLSSGNFTYFMASNVSVGGMFLRCDEPLSMGTPLKLQFSLPETKDPILIEADVVRIQRSAPDAASSAPSGMGIKFTSISKKDQKAILEYVEKKL